MRTKILAFLLILSFIQAYCFDAIIRCDVSQMPFPSQSNSYMIEALSLSLKERADSLQSIFIKIQQSSSIEDRRKYEALFFLLFPDTHQMLELFYGLDYKTERLGLLFEHGCDHMDEFFRLRSVHKDTLIRKIINISIDATWDHASMTFQNGVQLKYVKELDEFCEVLSEYSDIEVFSFWYFFFDGPHPDNQKDEYHNLYSQTKVLNPRISDFMRQAYEKLLTEEKCQGH